MSILGDDLREFFFGCNVMFETHNQMARRRTAIATAVFETKIADENVKVKAKIFKTSKLKCLRCQLYQPVVFDGICKDCQRVMDQVALIENSEQKLLE